MTGIFVVRAGKALAVFLFVALILLGVAWSFTSSFDGASLELRTRFEDAPDPIVPVTRFLEGARYQLFQWIISASFASWICASIFLIRAEQHPARDAREGRGRLVLWILLLILVFAFIGAIWYATVGTENVAGILLADGYVMVVALTFILLPLAYWLATALAVKIEMRPSVPVSGPLPTFWS